MKHLVPEQLPQGIETIENKKYIVYSNGDEQVSLFCRATKSGAIKVRSAESWDMDYETGDCDTTPLTSAEGVQRFGYNRVLNPLSGKVVDLS